MISFVTTLKINLYMRWKFNLIILFTNLSDKQKHFCRKEIRQNSRISGSLFVMKLNFRNKSHLSFIECFFYINSPKIFFKIGTKNHARKKGQRRRVYSHILWPSLRKNTKTVQNSSTLTLNSLFCFEKSS